MIAGSRGRLFNARRPSTSRDATDFSKTSALTTLDRMRFSILLVALLSACGSIDPEPVLDAQGNPIPSPEAGEPWLVVEQITPDADVIPSSPEITIQFSDHLEDDLLVDYDVISLVSGGKRVGGRAAWNAVTKTLTWRPFGSLIDGLDYTLQLNNARLLSVVGSPLFPTKRKVWRVDASQDSPAIQAVADVRWSDVERVLKTRCWSCHQDPEWKLNPLTRESMIGERSDGGDEILVVPFDPSDSYLLQKIVPDYPTIRWDVQPPVWSGAQPLGEREVRLVESWIRQGARSDLDALP